MAAAWQRLIDNKFIKTDLILLQHEYAKALIMEGLKINYSPAYKIVSEIYDWKNSL